MDNTLRITAGAYKGRKIKTPGEGTHPMGERERIALFNMIADKIPGAKVLDAYCGSGALGIEALSRGADEVVFVEKSYVAMRTANENCRLLRFPEEKVCFYRGAVGAFLNSPMAFILMTFPRKVDIILADPPYNKLNVEEISQLTRDYLKEGGTLVLSHAGEAPEFLEVPELKLVTTKKYAQAHISIYEKNK